MKSCVSSVLGCLSQDWAGEQRRSVTVCGSVQCYCEAMVWMPKYHIMCKHPLNFCISLSVYELFLTDDKQWVKTLKLLLFLKQQTSDKTLPDRAHIMF